MIGGYLPGTPYFGSLLVGYYEGGKLIFIGKGQERLRAAHAQGAVGAHAARSRRRSARSPICPSRRTRAAAKRSPPRS